MTPPMSVHFEIARTATLAAVVCAICLIYLIASIWRARRAVWRSNVAAFAAVASRFVAACAFAAVFLDLQVVWTRFVPAPLAIVLDDSASLARRLGDATAWDVALDLAAK
ncbi:MAG: hypothetical protein HUK22_01490, partial [Thermoguttaceae bacterium]|nr:hypothetical protein [Thermoguttaceae bacterium]